MKKVLIFLCALSCFISSSVFATPEERELGRKVNVVYQLAEQFRRDYGLFPTEKCEAAKVPFEEAVDIVYRNRQSDYVYRDNGVYINCLKDTLSLVVASLKVQQQLDVILAYKYLRQHNAELAEAHLRNITARHSENRDTYTIYRLNHGTIRSKLERLQSGSDIQVHMTQREVYEEITRIRVAAETVYDLEVLGLLESFSGFINRFINEDSYLLFAGRQRAVLFSEQGIMGCLAKELETKLCSETKREDVIFEFNRLGMYEKSFSYKRGLNILERQIKCGVKFSERAEDFSIDTEYRRRDWIISSASQEARRIQEQERRQQEEREIRQAQEQERRRQAEEREIRQILEQGRRQQEERRQQEVSVQRSREIEAAEERLRQAPTEEVGDNQYIVLRDKIEKDKRIEEDRQVALRLHAELNG